MIYSLGYLSQEECNAVSRERPPDRIGLVARQVQLVGHRSNMECGGGRSSSGRNRCSEWVEGKVIVAVNAEEFFPSSLSPGGSIRPPVSCFSTPLLETERSPPPDRQRSEHCLHAIEIHVSRSHQPASQPGPARPYS